GIARLETVGPVLLTRLRELLAGTHLTIKPVIDPDITPVDSYEIPHRVREQVVLNHPYEIYPYGGAESRHVDLDHTQPYRTKDDGGPPGQTRPDNLGPMSRNPHRLETHSPWNLRQPSPGVFLWRTTHGYINLVTNRGTLTLGNGDYAQTLWRTAAPAGTQGR
ncbi:MAG TPA: HNH endonuclease, partial [Propionibacteriaceae bacterium]